MPKTVSLEIKTRGEQEFTYVMSIDDVVDAISDKFKLMTEANNIGDFELDIIIEGDGTATIHGHKDL